MTSTPTGARQNLDPSHTTQLRVPSHRTGTTGAFRRLRKSLPKYDYEHYSRLAGPLTQPDPTKPYKVQYRSLLSQEPHRIRAALMLGAAPLLSLVLLAWLLQPAHWTQRDYPAFSWLPALDVVDLPSMGEDGQPVGVAAFRAKIVSMRRLLAPRPPSVQQSTPRERHSVRPTTRLPLLAIGASTGGPNAVARVLADLPRPIDCANWNRVRFSLRSRSWMCTGSRIERERSAIARVMP